MIRQAVIVAGGRGTRLGALARKHGNKSLVPVLGKPLLCRTVEWLKKAGVKSIIVTVNYVTEFKKILALFRGDTSVAVIGNMSRISSAECLHPIQGMLDERFLFVYGHAPVPPEHIEKLSTATQDEVVVTLYSTTTQRKIRKKAAKLEGSRVILDEEGDLFIEPPHILNREFVGILIQTESWKESFQLYSGHIFGVRASHPPEYHYPKDLEQVRAWLAKKIKKEVPKKKRGEQFGEVVTNYQQYRKSHPREIFAELFSLMKNKGGAVILDLACGSGKSTEPLVRKNTSVIGCDTDRRMLREASNLARAKHLPITYVHGRAESLPFEGNTFDAVVIGSAFHWFASRRAVTEIRRVLKPDGLIFIFQYRYPTTEKEEEYNEEAPLLRDCGIEYPERERARGTAEFFTNILKSGGFKDIQTLTIKKFRRYSVAERVGRVKTLSAYTLLSAKDKRKMIAELERALKKKWGKRRYRLIPQIVNLCYGYKPK